jgi:hypothetical protein
MDEYMLKVQLVPTSLDSFIFDLSKKIKYYILLMSVDLSSQVALGRAQTLLYSSHAQHTAHGPVKALSLTREAQNLGYLGSFFHKNILKYV